MMMQHVYFVDTPTSLLQEPALIDVSVEGAEGGNPLPKGM